MRGVVIALGLLVAFVGSATARTAADDVALGLTHTALNTRPDAGLSEPLGFGVAAVLTLDGGEGGEIRLTVTLPAGLSWGRRAPGATAGCTTSPQGAVCARNAAPTSGTNLLASFGVWDVVAASPGTYEIEAVVESAKTDPDPSNNSARLAVKVEPLPGGVTVRPRRPVAGGPLVASHPVWSRSGEQVFRLVTGSVRCTATVGASRAATKAALAAGRATCTVTTPKAATGKTVRGQIVTTSGGLRLVKTFSAKLR